MTIHVTGHRGLAGPPSVSLRVSPARFGGVRPEMQRLTRLTPRDRDVLCLVARGWGNPRIAQHLGLSRAHVRVRISSILMKLDVGTRTEAALLGQRLGLDGVDLRHNQGTGRVPEPVEE